ncbi:dienelactone hydrolase family protein [Dermatophilaceae bacterium Soc4.6]
MKLREEEVRVAAPDCEIRTIWIRPVGDGPWPAVLFYSDIFQLTESTLRTARRLASYGFAVFAPEIYPRTLAGVALEFDDAGKVAGMAGAAATTTAQFDSDRVALLDHLAGRADVTDVFCVGFCIGGHLAFRAAFDERVSATVCFYPTGLQDGQVGADADSRTLARAADVTGRMMVVFGTNDPHVPAAARLQVLTSLYAAGSEHVELHVYAGGEHAFMRDIGPRHDPDLTDASLAAAVSFMTRR